jgi:hypothetical protein
MNRKTLLLLVAVVLFLGTAALYPQTTIAQDSYEGRTITGTVYFIGGRRPARSLPFRLIVNRISTPDEVNQLNSALQSGGEEELMRRLERMDAGRIEIGTGVGVPANFIIRTDEGGPYEAGRPLPARHTVWRTALRNTQERLSVRVRGAACGPWCERGHVDTSSAGSFARWQHVGS